MGKDNNEKHTISIILTTLVVKAMCDFVTNDTADGTKVQVTRHLMVKN